MKNSSTENSLNYYRKKYAELKAKGICTACRKRKASEGYVHCEQCREEHKAGKLYLVSLGICRCCQNEDAEPGKQLCYECAERKQKVQKARRKLASPEKKAEMQAYNITYNKQRRQKSLSSGICTRCHKRKAQAGIRLCIDCRIKKRKEWEQKKPDTLLRSERPAYGLCYVCGLQPVVDGKKLCRKHLGIARACMIKATEKVNLQKHRWRKQNNAIFTKTKTVKKG